MGGFDISLKHVVTTFPHDWAVFLGVPPDRPVKLLDTDLSTVQAMADKVFSIGGPEPFILHLEPQAQYDPDLDARVLGYAATLYRRHRLPVESTVLMLEPRVAGKAVTGRVKMASPSKECTLAFRYRMVKVWKLPTTLLLQQGLGILPLAPLGAGPVQELPRVIERMAERFADETTPSETGELWTATSVLLGLKYKKELIRTILQSVRHQMQNSAMYQEILKEGLEKGLEKGRIEGREEGREEGELRMVRRSIFRLGTRRLGPPPAAVESMINQEQSVTVLQLLLDRVVEAASWESLL